MLLKRRFSSTASASDEIRTSPPADSVGDTLNDDDDVWDLKRAVGPDDVVLVGANRRLRHFQDISRAEKFNVPGTVAEAIKLSSKLVNQETPADAGLSNELVSMKSAPTTAKAGEKIAQDQLALL